MAAILGTTIPLAYLIMWTLTAKILFRRYRMIEGEKRNCPRRLKEPDIHDHRCPECAAVNKQWWQDKGYTTTAKGLSDMNLAWDCIAQGFVWPIALLVYVMYSTIITGAPRSPREIEAERAAQAEKIKRLENELDTALGRK